MVSFEETIERACEDGSMGGAVVMARNKSGSLNYGKAFGSITKKPGVLTLLFLGLCQLCLHFKLDPTVRRLGRCASVVRKMMPKGSRQPLSIDAIMGLASCTKLLTSVAAMQCVERGLWKLDDDIAPILPELAKLEILTGFDAAGKPITTQRKNPITLRMLLTHTAGLSYENHPLLTQYRKSRGEELHAGTNVAERFGSALVYEPGTSWRYSPGLDWAGKLVERLTNETLEAYMKKSICAPLHADDIMFHVLKRPEAKRRLPGLGVRVPGGPLMSCPIPKLLSASVDCEGGGGGYASMPSYFKVLESLLIDDEKLLNKETAAQLFKPQLDERQRKAMAVQMAEPEFVGHLPPHVGWDHGLGGILSMSDDEGWRKKGTLIWTGLFNLVWFIDREDGLCGIFGTQIIPSADPVATELATLFQKSMYEQASTSIN